MPSERKLLAARANGALCKGHKTPQGIAHSSANAVTHGLTARNLVLTNESRKQYEALRESWIAALKPQDCVELGIVEQAIAARWRLERVLSMECALLDWEMKKQQENVEVLFVNVDGDTRLALAFRTLADESRTLALLSRYESRHRRDCARAIETLQTLRSIRPEPATDSPRQE